MKLSEIVPWGRSLAEYRAMFDLDASPVDGAVLDCAGGPASFNAEWTALGGRAVSCDPLYGFHRAEIEQRIAETYPQILAGTAANAAAYRWDAIRSPEELGQVRLQAMRRFLADYEAGLEAGRYVRAALPKLPFADGQFAVALCSHLLFTYSGQLPLEFHVAAIEEMCRVAGEARVFPLLNGDGSASPWLEPCTEALEAKGCRVEVRRVGYEFQRGGDRMMVVRAGER